VKVRAFEVPMPPCESYALAVNVYVPGAETTYWKPSRPLRKGR
jgi:hypothetical protein